MALPTTLKQLGPGHERLPIAPEIFDIMDESILHHWTDTITDVRMRQTGAGL